MQKIIIKENDATVITRKGDRNYYSTNLIGQWGRAKVSGGRYFWTISNKIFGEGIWIEGFTYAEQEAEAAAVDAIKNTFPQGYVFKFSAGFASSRYSRVHAKATTFKNDWRGKFPFWAERTHLHTGGYHYDDNGTWQRQHLIVSVTDKLVNIAEENLSAISNGDRIPRKRTIALSRQELEANSEAYSQTTNRHYSINPVVMPGMYCKKDDTNRIGELRSIMQENHPDKKPGDADATAAFIKARKELDRIRGDRV